MDDERKQLEEEIFGGSDDDGASELSEADLPDLNEQTRPEISTASIEKPSINEVETGENPVEISTRKSGENYKIPKRKTDDRERIKKPRKKKRIRTVVADEEQGADQEQQQQLPEQLTEFDAVVNSLKSKRRTTADGDEVDNDEYIARVLNEMRLAAQQDRQSNELKQPATAKLRLLDSVTTLFNKTYLHEQLMDHETLDCIRLWLEPLPDGSLPSYNIRQALFEVLPKLPTHSDQIKDSDIGKVVMFYCRNEGETGEIRKMATEIIHQWARPYLQQSRRVLPKSNRESQASQGPRQSTQAAEERDTRFARVPQAIRRTYTVVPDSMASADADLQFGSKEKTKLHKILNNKSGAGSRNVGGDKGRINKVSVEGRKL